MHNVFSRANDRHVLTTELWLPRRIDEVFGFFADAGNLGRITPPWLDFKIISPLPIKMREGALIDYRIKLHGVPVSWRTRIAVWEPGRRFVDEQIRGPYTLWSHEHTFEPSGDGTLCRDRVEYQHLGGSMVHRLFVRPELDKIFGFRRRVLWSIFGDGGDADAEDGVESRKSVGAPAA